MSTTASPSGLLLRRNPSGAPRSNAYTILPGYATGIGYGDLVSLSTNGTLTQTAASADAIGMFAGVEYIDATGKPTESKNWPTGGVSGATNIRAYVYDDFDNIYAIQVTANGITYDQTAIGAHADIVVGTPNASSGQSTMALNSTLKAAGVQGQMRIVGYEADGFYDANNNPFPVVLVQLAQHQYTANKVSI